MPWCIRSAAGWRRRNARLPRRCWRGLAAAAAAVASLALLTFWRQEAAVGGSLQPGASAGRAGAVRSVVAERRRCGEKTAPEDRRGAFVCAAGCAEREPQLEESLAPWAEMHAVAENMSGLEALDVMMEFCQAERSCKDPFIIVVLIDGEIHLRACRANNIHTEALYLIGPEDLSVVVILLLAALRVATLPPGPTVFGMYLSDYSCLLDRHRVGPGVPIFAYLTRETSWLIPWPSSFSLFSTMEAEGQWPVAAAPAAPVPWAARSPSAFWIGAVTGPWEFVPDAALVAVPRLKLLRLAARRPDLLRAEWSSLASYGISWVDPGEEALAGVMAKQRRSVEDLTGVARSTFKRVVNWDHFKYYVNIDGVVMGGRLSKLMSLGGVVLQHQAGYYEHYEALLEPNVHYLPVAYDLSDLLPTIEWLRAHDAEARRIATQAALLARTRMRLEDDLCYVWRALEALSSTAAGADGAAVRAALHRHSFRRVPSAASGGLREILEGLWNSRLEDVSTGDRRMTKKGIAMLEWLWRRLFAIGPAGA